MKLPKLNNTVSVILSLVLATAVFVGTYTIQNQKKTKQDQGATLPTAVSTFESIGLYWSPTGGSQSNVANVQYRISGSTQWNQGYPLWFDSRNNEYRGSLVNLSSGSQYEIKLTLSNTGTSQTITASTWNDNFPIAKTVTLPESSNGLTISESGNSTGYILYTHAPGKTSVLQNCSTQCVNVQNGVHHVIIRELTIKDGRYGILLNSNHDIVIEGNDISNWSSGNDYEGAIYSHNSSLTRIIVQRNRMHDPSHGSNSWETGHPQGPQGIVFFDSAGNHVIRYNEIYSNNGNWFNDGMGAGANCSHAGFPNKDSDIYGNFISNYWDDSIESEGANKNVRIWGNYSGRGFVKIATAGTSEGPLYIFRNITGVAMRTANQLGNGGFVKTNNNSSCSGGRIFSFHNTILQPNGDGASTAYGWGGPISNLYSRNNILNAGTIVRNLDSLSSYDYDLYKSSVPSGTESNGIHGTPTYAGTTVLSTNKKGNFSLSANSLGYDKGQILYGFNNTSFTGTAPDMGAQEAGTPNMEFGVNAYLISNVSPTPLPEVTLTPTPKPTITPTPNSLKPGDVNGDGVVDIIDFQLLSNTYGLRAGQNGYNQNADFNGDNVVDILDFQILSNNFGT